jgi:hypothetical protein
MELDGYCAPLGIAFEHQGEHHYSTKGYFIDSEFDLLQRQEDDALKTTLCTQRGITLVPVPEIPTRLPLNQVRAFIKEQLAAKGVPLPHDFDTRELHIDKAYRTSGSRVIFNDLRRIAAEHGGQCLSTSYVNDGTKLLWQCAGGHKWMAAPSDTKQGKWCPFCAGTVRKTLEQMQEIAAARGGKCLSPVYEGNHRKLLWGCSQGHRWEATPAHIQQGKWCPKCSGNVRKTMEEMKVIAAARGGKCLSRVYKNNKTRLLWQCHAGHTWEAIPSSVQRGSWCPYCSGNLKKTMKDMRNLAAQHGGQCLSGEYVNTDTHLLWQCKEGHQWKAVPDSIRTGHWCPVCAKRKRRQ